MKKTFPLILLALLLGACQNKSILDETRTFANSNWQRFEPETFEANINNIDDCYDLYVDAVIDTATYRDKTLPIIMSIFAPNGERRTIVGTIQVVNKNGTFMGTVDGGQVTCTQKIRDYLYFNNAGSHKFEISQRTSHYDLRGVRSMTFRIVKSDLKLPD